MLWKNCGFACVGAQLERLKRGISPRRRVAFTASLRTSHSNGGGHNPPTHTIKNLTFPYSKPRRHCHISHQLSVAVAAPQGLFCLYCSTDIITTGPPLMIMCRQREAINTIRRVRKHTDLLWPAGAHLARGELCFTLINHPHYLSG